MGISNEQVTLTGEQVGHLQRELANLRHDVNNHLALIMAAVEVVAYKPDTAAKMIATVGEQPSKIGAAITKFSAELENALSGRR